MPLIVRRSRGSGDGSRLSEAALRLAVPGRGNVARSPTVPGVESGSECWVVRNLIFSKAFW